MNAKIKRISVDVCFVQRNIKQKDPYLNDAGLFTDYVKKFSFKNLPNSRWRSVEIAPEGLLRQVNAGTPTWSNQLVQFISMLTMPQKRHEAADDAGHHFFIWFFFSPSPRRVIAS